MSKVPRKLHVEPAPGDEAFVVKVAFMTADRHHVDQHFGSAEGVMIYALNEHKWQLVEAIEYLPSPGQTHARLPGRIADLKQCAAVYCNACGSAAIRQLLAQDINPVRVAEGADIHIILSELQQELRGTPVGWLGRALKQVQQEQQSGDAKADWLNAMMDEEWI